MNKSIQNLIATAISLSPAEWIDGFLSYIQSLGGAAAVWRLPEGNKVHLLADLSGGTVLESFQLQDLPTGFLIAPFQNHSNKSIHLKADFHLSMEVDHMSENLGNVTVKVQKDNAQHQEAFVKQLQESKHDFQLPKGKIQQSTEKLTYMAAVQKGIQAIKKEVFYKIVPSKIKVLPHQENIKLGSAFIKACSKYQNAFVNMSCTPHSGVWFGASPETLIENLQDQYFKTVALAGTQAATDKAVSETAWTQKEIEEQAYVSRYIINCFKKIRLREYIEIGPKTIQAGSLLHLKTTYKVNTTEVNFTELASVMLELLHPTSAVCGMPKKASLSFLDQEEVHDRAYFSGYLGPVQQEGHTHLFVNLRCCQLSKEQVCFYAGAGITEDSIPEKEWEETEMKCQVLADIIFES